jgi:periplasmic protein TonB
VTQDYTDQKVGAAPAPTIGGGAAAPDSGVNRMVLMAYANSTTRTLNEFLARERELKKQDYQVRVDLWLTPTGSTQRAELVGSTGDAAVDRVLREALQRFPGTTAALPERLPLPIRLMVSNRMMG